MVKMSDLMWAICVMVCHNLGCEMHDAFSRSMFLMKTVLDECGEGDQLAIVDSEGNIVTTITYK
jgi:hypothetical protein